MAKDIGSGSTTELARGATISRYLVLSLLGKGGLGEVYAAYDPELDRKVAIKVLRASSSTGADAIDGRGRILREAQALAQLSDPNVVAVYDVGTFGERVFLAMEFVDGSTLRYWQHAQVRSWRETVEVYVAAGRGLAAAHRRGLIHRDFKPDNAMVGRDGQVRVMDLGLARSEMAPDPLARAASGASSGSGAFGTGTSRVTATIGATLSGSTPNAAAPDAIAAPAPGLEPDWDIVTRDQSKAAGLDRPTNPSLSALMSSLNQSGALVGTPAYMAPEQFAGKTADAKSDQFSFCLALYEGLYGERPFAGTNMPELTRHVMAGRVREAPASARVPGWLRKVLLCGLRVERDERHPSMEALLAALSSDPGRRRRRYAGAAFIGGLIAVMVGGLIHASQQEKTKCLGGAEKLVGVWELAGQSGGLTPRKESIRRAFAATGKRYAADAFALACKALDHYVGAWNAMHRDACEATHVRGEQSGEVLDLRMTCLLGRFNEVRALTSVFSDATGDVVDRSAEAVQALRPVEACADIAALKAVVRPPEDLAVRQAVAGVRARLTDVKALRDAGRFKQAVARVGRILEEARQTRYDPVIAEALLESALVSSALGEFAGVGRQYEDALWLAESSRHDEVAVVAAAQLVYSGPEGPSRHSDAERWARHAAAILARLGPGHDLVAGWIANNRAMVYDEDGRLSESLAMGLEAVRLKEKALGAGHFDVATSYANVAYTLLRLGRTDEALQKNTHALSILQSTLGPDHPGTASCLAIRAEILNAMGRWQEAADLARRALTIWEREWGPEHPDLGFPLTSLGTALVELGRAAEAQPVLERALRLREAKDPAPDRLGVSRFALARALWTIGGSQERARRLAELAEADLVKSRDASIRQRASEVGRWRRARWPQPVYSGSAKSLAASLTSHSKKPMSGLDVSTP